MRKVLNHRMVHAFISQREIWVNLLLVTFILFALSLLVQSGFADSGAEDIAIRSFNSTGDGVLSVKAQRLTLLVLWLLVVGILTVGILSSSSHGSMDRLVRLGKGPDASNLYLGIRFTVVGEESEPHSGFIRSLGMRKATFVANRTIPKLTRIRMDFASLPGFDGDDHVVEAIVHKVRSIDRDTGHYMIEVIWSAMSDSARHSLSVYLTNIASPRSAYSRA